MEDTRETTLRKKIIEIQKDETLSSIQKAKKIQRLMSGKNPDEVEEEKVPQKKTEEQLDKSLSYHDESEKILGCEHYRRGCKIRAYCCGDLFVCRLCHDKIADHKIDRHATQEMLCMHCLTLQPIGQSCTKEGCEKNLGRYYCSVCKFHNDNEAAQIYHCDECGLCRVGKGLGIDFWHCPTCAMCLGIHMKDNHTCIENNLKSDCSICGKDLFTSRSSLEILKCGHSLHQKCFKKYLRNGNFTCPLCGKSAWEMKDTWEELDALVAAQPMPKQFDQSTADILCNDCGNKATVKFHFVGHKCPKCGSYNSAVVGRDLRLPPEGLAELYGYGEGEDMPSSEDEEIPSEESNSDEEESVSGEEN